MATALIGTGSYAEIPIPFIRRAGRRSGLAHEGEAMIDRRQFLAALPAAAGFAALPAAAGEPLPSRQDVLFDPDAPVLGNPQGDVTIVEYFDYQCPHCRKGHPGLMKAVKDDGKVRLVMKDWPIFGGASVTAAQAALGAVALGRYEVAVEALIAARPPLTEDGVFGALAKAGIDEAALVKAVNGRIATINGLLDRNHRQAVAFDFPGTPSFVINKAIFRGPLDGAAIGQMIRDARRA